MRYWVSYLTMLRAGATSPQSTKFTVVVCPVFRAWIRHHVFLYFPGSWIQFADITLECRCEPNMSILVCHKPVRSRLWNRKRVFLNVSGHGI